MTRILNTDKFPIDSVINENDIVIGSDADNSYKTKNYRIRDLRTFILNDYDSDGDSQVDGILNENGTYTWVKYSTSITGSDMVDSPTAETLYIGLAYNKTTAVESVDAADYTWSLISGEVFWIDENGTIHYTWLKYADTPISGMSDIPLGKSYIGFAFDKITPTESDIYTDYEWSKVTSNNSTDGIPLVGTSLYTWIKYADTINGAGLSDSPVGKLYIGIAYNKDTYVESNLAADYIWGLIDGLNVDINGKYTWVKYADTPLTGMSDDATGKSYLGLSFNNETAVESTVYADYQWSLIKGDANGDTTDGVATPTDSLFTWVKFADDTLGTNMNDDPAGRTYIGLAFNKTTSTESLNYTDYFWTLIGDSVSYIGADGKTYYIWVKYASDEIGTGMSDDPTGLSYIGLAYRNESPIESDVAADYEWALILSEIQEDLKWLYTWVKWADDELGAGMSDYPDGKLYLGLAYDKDTAIESIDPTDYVWTLVSDIQSYIGADGKTYYTWVKYADSPTSLDLYDTPDNADWMGMAFNKETPIESDDFSDYTWYFLAHDEVAITTAFNQNNLIREIAIDINDLIGGIVSEETISEYINTNGLEVSEFENVVFVIDGIVDEIVPPPLIVLNDSDLVLSGGVPTETTIDGLVWDALGDTAIVRYDVSYIKTNGGGIYLDNLLNVLTTDLTGLESGTEYSIYVTAYDSYGNTKQSNTLVRSTDTVFVASTPNIYLDAKTDSTITLSWEIEASFNHDRFELWQVGVGKIYDTTSVSDLTKQITGLSENTLYQFYVIAYSGVTASNPSDTLDVTTFETAISTLLAPEIKYLSSTETSIYIGIILVPAEWAITTAYLIEYRLINTTAWIQKGTLNNNIGQFLEDLTPASTYQIRLRSTTDGIVYSDYSNTITASTNDLVSAQLIITPSVGDYYIPFGSLRIVNGEPNTTVKVAIETFYTQNGFLYTDIPQPTLTVTHYDADVISTIDIVENQLTIDIPLNDLGESLAICSFQTIEWGLAIEYKAVFQLFNSVNGVDEDFKNGTLIYTT